jgi:hypothetical protein
LETETLVVIPQAAVKHIGQLTLVDVVEGERLVRRSLQVGRLIGDEAVVLSGVQPGEKIVIPSETTDSNDEGNSK